MKKNKKTRLYIHITFILFSAYTIISTQDVQASSITNEKILELVNTSRFDHGLEALKKNKILELTAEDKANDMLDNSYFAHTSPQGKTPWYWIEKNRYSYSHAGENLAIHFSNAETEHRAWMESSSHRKNILQPLYTETGIAVKQGLWKGIETTVVVQIFGSPSKISFISEKNIGKIKKTDSETLRKNNHTTKGTGFFALDTVKTKNELRALQNAHATLFFILILIFTLDILCIGTLPIRNLLIPDTQKKSQQYTFVSKYPY